MDVDFNHQVMRWPRARLLAMVSMIEAAIRDKKGFSVIRLGDGEGAIMDLDNSQISEARACQLTAWFGDQQLADSELRLIREGLGWAISSSDILGLPRRRQLDGVSTSPGCRAVIRRVEELLDGNRPIITDMALHNYFQWSGFLRRLMEGRDRPSIITPRDLGGRLAAEFNIRDLHWFPVRGAANYPGEVFERHWPDGFRRVTDRIEREVAPGDVFLVGAGVLGKIYCAQIKARGAVAIDIGSVFDGWAGVNSRPRLTSRPWAQLSYLRELSTSDADLTLQLGQIIPQTHISDGVF